LKKNSNFTLDRKQNVQWRDYFNTKIAPDKRLTKQRLKEFLAKRYKDGLAQRITSLMSQFLSNYTQATISLDEFAQGLELMFNRDENALRKMAFEIFDVNKDKKLSENDMFDLMKMCSGTRGGKMDDAPVILALDQKMSDLFLDVFSQDYIKIIKVLDRKKAAQGISHDDLMTKKLENLSHGLNTNAKSIGNDVKFGKKKDPKAKESTQISREEASNDRQGSIKIDDQGTAAKK
jgi:Ca2+-binding EF-hand superfamily protein